MPLKTVRLDDLRHHRNWVSAPVGALLQMVVAINGEENVFYGMRCVLSDAGEGDPYFFILNGQHRGVVLRQDSLSNACLEVDHLIQLNVGVQKGIRKSQTSDAPQQGSLFYESDILNLFGVSEGGSPIRVVALGSDKGKAYFYRGPFYQKVIVGLADVIERERASGEQANGT